MNRDGDKSYFCHHYRAGAKIAALLPDTRIESLEFTPACFFTTESEAAGSQLPLLWHALCACPAGGK